MQSFAWIGTGPCNDTDVAMARLMQYGVVAGVVVAIVFIIKRLFIRKSLVSKVAGVIAIIGLLVSAFMAIVFIGLGAACTGWGGFF